MYQDEEHHHKHKLHVAFSRLARTLGCRWYDMYYVERGLHKPIEDVRPGLAVSIRRATPKDERDIMLNRPKHQHGRLAFRFASERTRVYVAHAEEALVGYTMISTGLMDITGLDAKELAIRQRSSCKPGLSDDLEWRRL